MDLLDESLPSDSTFLGQSMQRTMRTSSYVPTYPAISEESYEDDFVDYYKDHGDDKYELSRTSSPPPPPPPLSDSFIASENRPDPPKLAYQISSAQNDRASATSLTIPVQQESRRPPAERKGPFPFLKKKSRKEPSALNRKASPPESPNNTPDHFPPAPTRPDKSAAHTQNYQFNGNADRTGQNNPRQTAKSSTAPAPSRSTLRTTPENDILLSGDDYWGLDSSLAQDIQHLERTKGSVKSYLDDTLEQSNVSNITIGLNDWKRNKPVNEEADDEFQQLERNLLQSSKFRDSRDNREAEEEEDRDDYYTKPTASSNNYSYENQNRNTSSRPQSTLKLAQNTTAQSVSSNMNTSWGAVTQPQPPSSRPSPSVDPPPPSTFSSTTPANTRLSNQSLAKSVSNKTPSSRREETTVVRPLSTHRSDPPSTTQSNNRRRSSSQPRGKSNASTSDLQRALEEKAKELEAELETYKTENVTLRRLKKQTEQGLVEITRKKEEIIRWSEEEKAKTLAWCEEMKQQAEKERRVAAKQARESRLKAANGSVPIRKEKAEQEALQATIEKMKASHDQVGKKWKLNENRLYGVIKEHMKHIENLDQQIIALEEQKILLMDFIAQSGLRLPKSLRTKILNSATVTETLTTPSNTMKKPTSFLHNKRNSERGYVEEVDVEMLPAEVTHLTKPINRVGREKEGGLGYGRDSWARSSKSSTRYSSSLGEEDSVEGADREDIEAVYSIAQDIVKSSARSSSCDEAYHIPSSRNSMGRSGLGIAEVNSGARHSKPVENKPFSSGNNEDIAPQAMSKASANKTTNLHTLPHTIPSTMPSTVPYTMSNTISNAAPSGENKDNNRTEEVLSDGTRRITYRNGTVKIIDPTGKSIVKFTNGDIKTTHSASGTVVYYYSQAQTTHTTYADGVEVYEFPNQQSEKHYPDGRKEVIFPDRTRKVIEANGVQESHFPDGVVLREYPDGRKEVVSEGR